MTRSRKCKTNAFLLFQVLELIGEVTPSNLDSEAPISHFLLFDFENSKREPRSVTLIRELLVDFHPSAMERNVIVRNANAHCSVLSVTLICQRLKPDKDRDTGPNKGPVSVYTHAQSTRTLTLTYCVL